MKSIIREKRIEMGMTQAQLADKVFCVHQHISNLENEGKLPSVAMAKQLGKVLGFPWWEIFEDV